MYFCPQCTYLPVELIKRSSEEYYCPCCHTSFGDKLIKTAQFGGQPGGIPSSGVPWATNQTRRVPYGNPSDSEEGLDSYMEKTRKHIENDNTDRNIEKKLETFHTGLEEDMKPYELTSRERQLQNQKDVIRRRNIQQQQFSKSVDENSVAYIKEHFQTPDKHMRTMEMQLDTVRKNITPPRTSLPTFTTHDQKLLPLPEKGISSLLKTSKVQAQTKVRRTTNTIFDDRGEDNQWGANQFHTPQEAGFRDHTSWVKNQSDLDNEAFGNEEMKFLIAPEDTAAFPKDSTEARPYEAYVPAGNPPEPDQEQTAPMGELKNIDNPFMPLQSKMDQIQEQRTPTQNLPQDQFPGEDASQRLMRPRKKSKPFSAYQDTYNYQSTADGTPLGG